MGTAFALAQAASEGAKRTSTQGKTTYSLEFTLKSIDSRVQPLYNPLKRSYKAKEVRKYENPGVIEQLQPEPGLCGQRGERGENWSRRTSTITQGYR
jgi:hypothetical protein